MPLPREVLIRVVNPRSGDDEYLAADTDTGDLLNIDDADEAQIGVYRLVETRKVRRRIDVVSTRKA